MFHSFGHIYVAVSISCTIHYHIVSDV